MRREETGPVTAWHRRWLDGASIGCLGLFVLFIALLIGADFLLIDRAAVVEALTTPEILHALWLSVWTSFAAVAAALLFAIPGGYALSRFRFPGRVVVDAIVDLPIVFPPLVAGLTLLVFFSQTSVGNWIEDDLGLEFVFRPQGIVLCQFLVSASLAIRSAKVAFDEVDRRVEGVALTLGCTAWGRFRRVTLPLASNGILAGAILTWARAFGLFGPLLVFVGSFSGRTEVLSTRIFLELSVGNLEVALAIALLMILMALAALVVIRLVSRHTVVSP